MVTTTLQVGQTLPLSGTALLSDGYTPFFGGTFTWSSSNTSVATVNYYDNAFILRSGNSAIVTAVSVGNATISCISGSLSSTLAITVIADETPTSIEISLGSIQPGQPDN